MRASGACITDNPYAFTVPPVIHQGPKSKTINEGDSLSLQCNATGIPQPNITWSVEGWSAGDCVVGDNLLIAQANRSHAGQYTCTARNGVGRPASARARVTVNCMFSFYVPILETERHLWFHTIAECSGMLVDCLCGA